MVSTHFRNKLLSANPNGISVRIGFRVACIRDIIMKESLLNSIENIDKIIDKTDDARLKEMWKTKKDLKEKIKQRENGTRRTSS